MDWFFVMDMGKLVIGVGLTISTYLYTYILQLYHLSKGEERREREKREEKKKEKEQAKCSIHSDPR